jgi:hypothetical protein
MTMSEQGVLRGIQEILNAGYGDQATSPLDRTVAVTLFNHMRQTGWMTPVEVAIIVEAAGGSVSIPETLLAGDAPDELKSFHDEKNGTYTLSTRYNKVIPGELVDDRPEVEHRTVESGPIKVTPTKE